VTRALSFPPTPAWVFEDADDSTPYLYYIPYRAIPNLPSVKTVSDDDESVGLHRFRLVPSKPNDEFLLGVDDEIMPHPALTHFHQPLHGITWALTHMSRFMVVDDHRVDTLQKYLTNIVKHPEVALYRQIRIASPRFAPIWQSPMRGALLAVGFVDVGMYAELGCQDFPLSREAVQMVALLSYLLSQWKTKPTAASAPQPEGATDGFGRPGFGRAGTMNGNI
jgi:PUB domain